MHFASRKIKTFLQSNFYENLANFMGNQIVPGSFAHFAFLNAQIGNLLLGAQYHNINSPILSPMTDHFLQILDNSMRVGGAMDEHKPTDHSRIEALK